MHSAFGDTQMDDAAIYLGVWEHNLDAQRVYRRFGFEVIGSTAFQVEARSLAPFSRL